MKYIQDNGKIKLCETDNMDHLVRLTQTLMSYAISITAFASAYSFFEPSFNVMIIVVSPFI